ncbi:MAG: putative Thioredoxin-disulfide reductase [Spartobacteria bacterium]|nr:putative Thioredoxin-disulfide reductase [Spartobacteria bacterium]
MFPTNESNTTFMATSEVIVIGGGIAGLSAAIYLGRAQRDTLVVDSGHSMAKWEPSVENYLGFPKGVDGEELLKNGRRQAERYGAKFADDTVIDVTMHPSHFSVQGEKSTYEGKRVLLATGIFHIPPDIPGVKECLGHSMFFCKDCDGYRVRGKRIAVIGGNNDAVEYALAMLHYSPCVIVATNGDPVCWDEQHEAWLKEYEIPVETGGIRDLKHRRTKILALIYSPDRKVEIDYIFTTRGDIFHTRLAKKLGAKLDTDGQIEVDHCMRTSVPRLYAAGCVTPANCQMIIAAGQGATAAQAINRDSFEESLSNHELRRFREEQLEDEKTVPEGAAEPKP